MLLKKLKEITEYVHAYFIIVGNLDDLIDAIDEIDPNLEIGVVRSDPHSVEFACTEEPEFIHEVTAKLHCKGFAHMDEWLNPASFVASYDGHETDEFTAEWEEGSGPWDIYWNAGVLVRDPETGMEFHTGDRLISYDKYEVWRDLVESHPSIG